MNPVLVPSGGDEGIRTLDPLLAGQVLSQLSYTPRVLFEVCTLKIEQRTTVLGILVVSSFASLVR